MSKDEKPTPSRTRKPKDQPNPIDVAENVSWGYSARVIERRSGRAGRERKLPNIITNAGLDLIAEALREGTALPEITYVALGDNAATPLVTDVLLGNEVFRKQTTVQVAGTTGVSITTVYIAPGEANQQLQEIGWFAGAATGAADTGTMVARTLYAKLKDNLESIQIERTDTFS